MSKCERHNIDKECMAGCSAHPDNWYCPECDKERADTRRSDKAKELAREILDLAIQRAGMPGDLSNEDIDEWYNQSNYDIANVAMKLAKLVEGEG